MKRKKSIIVINILFLLFEVVGLIYSIFEYGWGMFRFYTQDSNYFAAISSVILLVYLFSDKKIPKWFTKMRYVAVLLLAITFVVTATILAPMRGGDYFALFMEGSKLYQHLICPWLFFVSFFALERRVPKEKTCIVCGMIPTIVYGIILIVLNILEIVDGPYPFLRVSSQPIHMTVMWLGVIMLGALFMSWGVWKLGTLSQHTKRKTA